ncbi:MAG: PepSY-associated TM helix domain-containing protein, partial [Pseudomonas caspiana]
FHFQLQMPHPWGRWLSTIAAMLMFIALITGIITHKKIFKEFFTFRPRKGQRSWLDGHNAIGVLALPFHLMITYSSLVIFMSLVMPASIVASYGKDTQAFFADVFPNTNTTKATGAAAALAPLAPIVRAGGQQWPDKEVERLVVYNPGDAAATVVVSPGAGSSVIHDPGINVVFNGVSGELLTAPTQRSVPLLVSGAMYGLHLGEFAGPLLRWLYFVFGIAGTAMIGTGLVMWLAKRQVKHAKTGVLPFELRLVEVLNIAGMAGLMIAIAAFFWANRLLPIGLAERSDWEINLFFSVWGLSVLPALLRKGRQAWREQLMLGAVLFAGLPLLDIVTSGEYLLASLQNQDWVLIGFDLTVLFTGLFMAWGAKKFRPVPPIAVAAEQRSASVIGTARFEKEVH